MLIIIFFDAHNIFFDTHAHGCGRTPGLVDRSTYCSSSNAWGARILAVCPLSSLQTLCHKDFSLLTIWKSTSHSVPTEIEVSHSVPRLSPLDLCRTSSVCPVLCPLGTGLCNCSSDLLIFVELRGEILITKREHHGLSSLSTLVGHCHHHWSPSLTVILLTAVITAITSWRIVRV